MWSFDVDARRQASAFLHACTHSLTPIHILSQLYFITFSHISITKENWIDSSCNCFVGLSKFVLGTWDRCHRFKALRTTLVLVAWNKMRLFVIWINLFIKFKLQTSDRIQSRQLHTHISIDKNWWSKNSRRRSRRINFYNPGT